MKTVFMDEDFYYHPHRKITIWFRAGECYRNVSDAAASAIEAAGKGNIYTDAPLPDDCIDVSITPSMRMRAPPGWASWHQARPSGRPSTLRQPNQASKAGSQVFK